MSKSSHEKDTNKSDSFTEMVRTDKGPRDYKWIALTPRFTRNDFAGYNQKDGSHIWDDAGKIYFFVPEDAYLAAKQELEAYKKAKQENDERFQLDIGRLQQELETARSILNQWEDEHIADIKKQLAEANARIAELENYSSSEREGHLIRLRDEARTQNKMLRDALTKLSKCTGGCEGPMGCMCSAPIALAALDETSNEELCK